MKRIGLLLFLLMLCFPVFSMEPKFQVTLAEVDAETDLGHLVEASVRSATERSFLPRLPYPLEEGEDVSVSIDPIILTGPYQVRCSLNFFFRGKALKLQLFAKGKSLASLGDSIETTLYSQLRYDALSLFDQIEGLSLGYVHGSSLSSSLPSGTLLHVGDQVAVSDNQGKRTGLLVTEGILQGDVPVARFLPLYGKTLLPGMALSKISGRTFTVSAPVSYQNSLITVGLEGTYSQNIGLYPFLFSLKVSALYRMDGSFATFGLTGLEVRLPLSLVFGSTRQGLANGSISAACRIGLGFSTTENEMILGSEAELSYQYSLSASWALQVGVSSKYWSLSDKAYDSGLSLILSTSYTW
ncbi:hypothetical protein [uncultured Sphaerochaeta sp.]|uniref:hypothetical protein n=1 Tax=uncultured Sphaerochaeta sp. TaxID=886478 RepID=UPI002A0A759A|nr:hypothetical protein [uncultured Sphaerochaeta sp.]